MTERPILFSGEMVRAILEGRKTQTRRVIAWKPRTPGVNLSASSLKPGHYFTGNPEHGWVLRSGSHGCWNDRTFPAHCPYGVVGTRLWVRETWQCTEPELPLLPLDPSLFSYWRKRVRYATDGDYDPVNPKPWKPSIHMPRWASRITLEITDVSVVRIQDLSYEDAEAEGVVCDRGYAIPTFAALWDSINSKRGYGWDLNPWVWAISFKRI